MTLDFSLFQNPEFYRKYSDSTSSLFSAKDFRSISNASAPEVMRVKKSYKLAAEIFAENLNTRPPKLTVFEGPGKLDGHSFILSGIPITFLDMSLLRLHQEDKGFQDLTHLIHEMSHGVHYQRSPEFAIYETKEGPYTFRRTISEGLATYTTEMTCRHFKDLDIFWYGLLAYEDLELWLQNCRSSFKSDLSLIIENKNKTDFLSISDFSIDGLNNSRRAYHHGYKIVKLAAEKHPLNILFELKESDWLDFAQVLI